ncbi:HNH endonuclease [Streptococcus sp. sy010]|uniref:HNH endonuclease n=1 Tax=Streptococcus sp. sy010 TaxID=2600148 RepID=UPI0011B44E9F|nr:HNH endonuclease [Streptococcus sp. sy010]TWT16474.1 HNH endonuclease [Streptococcus sp. sy010]
MNKIILTSELSELDLKALLLIFFNVNHKKDKFVVEGSFKVSKYSKLSADKGELFNELAYNLSSYYKLPFYTTRSSYQCIIDNDLKLSFDDFIKKLRALIMVNLSKIDDLEVIDKEMALAIIILRGSVDFTRNFMAVDIKRCNASEVYLDSLFRIVTSSDDLIKYLNWNFRELQKQYVTGESLRNTQLRINLRWVFNYLLSEIKQLSSYRYDLLESNQNQIGNLPQSNKSYETFLSRLSLYREKIAGQKLNETEILSFRNELFAEDNKIPRRSTQVKLVISNSTADKCSACYKYYPIDCRSFKQPKDGRYYFEYHHVISFSNDKTKLDISDNVVKLCPTCHRAMTPNRAESAYQKELIKNILFDRSDIMAFTKTYLNTNTDKETINKIYELLS